MAEVFGNVNVKYNPCKSIAQLKSEADYILGKRFTVEGLEQYLQEKERKRLEYQRMMRMCFMAVHSMNFINSGRKLRKKQKMRK